MRQRKIKNEEEKIEELSGYVVRRPADWKGRWEECFEGRRLQSDGKPDLSPKQEPEELTTTTGEQSRKSKIFLEIGCGKGQFITTLAQKNPEQYYIAVEGAGSVVLRALEKAEEKQLTNVLFMTDYINDLEEFFEKGEIAGIYLNFSDPWPKERHAKRRLTHSRYLQGYKHILNPGSFIEFKTDNDALFAFSLREFESNQMELVECTKDLHASAFAAKEVPTEYEEKFSKLWKKINYCKVRV